MKVKPVDCPNCLSKDVRREGDNTYPWVGAYRCQKCWYVWDEVQPVATKEV